MSEPDERERSTPAPSEAETVPVEAWGGDPSRTALRARRAFLLMLVGGVTILFLVMIRRFLVAMILAGVFASMSRGTYLSLARALRGRHRPAAMLTVVGLLLLIVVPVGAFLALVVAQAIDVASAAAPWIREQAGRWEELGERLEQLPVIGPILPEREALVARAADFAGTAGTFLVNNLGTATSLTVGVILQLFVMLYAVYFFLLDGPRILRRILHLAPLEDESEQKLIERFVSVTRATIKGSILVGLIQGALAGAPFFVLGLPGAAFWSTVMAVLSIIPVLGSGLVWAPTAVILVATGQVGAGIGLAVWGMLVVGTVDNFLRPRFVGRDTKMHDLLVLLSTFGGLAMFGILGFIVGPIVAALFLTLWDLYAVAFGELLPEVPEPADEGIG